MLRSRCGVRGTTDSEVLLALCEKFARRLAVLTRGTRGALLRSQTLSVEVAAPQMDVVDSVGSGEAFTAALLMGLVEGASLDQVGTRACTLAAYVRSQRQACRGSSGRVGASRQRARSRSYIAARAKHAWSRYPSSCFLPPHCVGQN